MNIFITFKKKFKRIFYFFLDDNEKNFIKQSNRQLVKNSECSKSKKILIQTPLDYYFLLFFKSLILENNFNKYEIYGLYPLVIYKIKIKSKKIIDLLPHSLIDFILRFLAFKKICKLYNSIGLKKIYKFSNNNFSYFSQKKKASIIFNNLKTKNDVLKLSYNKIIIGDLVYDTYLRWRSAATLDINDKFLEKIIFLSIRMIDNLNKFYRKNKILFYISTFSSYIHHGIPVRFFYNKKVKVYLSKPLSFQENIIQISDNHYFNSFNFYNLKSKIKKINKTQFSYAKKSLENKFFGKFDVTSSYLKFNPYNTNMIDSKINEFQGVLFLHDFFDSPHDYKFDLFPDFYEWAVFTFGVIKKNNLKIAIKPHPNSHPDIINFNKQLQKKFSDLFWLNNKISNRFILQKKNIKFGISVSGSVIYEMAYFKKIPIAIGENYFSSFSFIKKPKTLKEYEDQIINYHKIKLPKNIKEISIKIYHQIMLNQVDSFPCNISKNIFLKKMKSNSSQDLVKYNKLII
jgi:hypothetical protein